MRLFDASTRRLPQWRRRVSRSRPTERGIRTGLFQLDHLGGGYQAIERLAKTWTLRLPAMILLAHRSVRDRIANDHRQDARTAAAQATDMACAAETRRKAATASLLAPLKLRRLQSKAPRRRAILCQACRRQWLERLMAHHFQDTGGIRQRHTCIGRVLVTRWLVFEAHRRRIETKAEQGLRTMGSKRTDPHVGLDRFHAGAAS